MPPNQHRYTMSAGTTVGLVLVTALLLGACVGNKSPDSHPKTTYERVAAEGPPCQFVYWVPYHNTQITCIEVVYDNVLTPTAAPTLGGLAFAPDGTLYVAHTAAGEIWAMRDDDRDQFFDNTWRAVTGLRLPTRLTIHDGALYVTTTNGLLRIDPDGQYGFDVPVTLVTDLGGDTQFWPGSVEVGPSNRIFVGLGGEVASFALDGSDRRIEATGLRYATDFAWHPNSGELWIADSRGPTALYDAVYRVPQTATSPDFGYPDCPVPSADAACANVPQPVAIFADQSNPVGLAFYSFDGWPFWQGDLIVTLGGSWNRVEPSGYAVSVIGVDNDGQPTGSRDLIAPTNEHPSYAMSLAAFSLRGMGFFPDHPVDVVVSAEGWLYVSIQEGRIFRIRPRPARKVDQPLTPTPVTTPGS